MLSILLVLVVFTFLPPSLFFVIKPHPNCAVYVGTPLAHQIYALIASVVFANFTEWGLGKEERGGA